MAVKLTAITNIVVFLPSEFEQHPKLEKILDKALDRGASETSTIGPCIMFENTTAMKALEIVEKILKQMRID